MAPCSCCGEERPGVVALRSRHDVRLCRQCIAWLRSESGVVDSTPILPVTDMDRSIAFYRACGFEVRPWSGGGYAFVSFEDESVFDLDAVDSPPSGAGCYLVVPDVDEWHSRFAAAGQPVTAVEAMPWDMRECRVTDPDGNYVRIGTPVPD